ncbi:MAG TPA: T9SS type A sorting domain-containing protein, partial [Bacteroidota bacterium]|nr:T9SS type A sorting domain-containing protein [Bacteroidota bacterium]
QNYPNPFNPTTTISFDVPERALVSISIYNTLGERVATLLNNAAFDQGEQTVEFNASAISSGVYFYRMTALVQKGNGTIFTDVKKMLLLK